LLIQFGALPANFLSVFTLLDVGVQDDFRIRFLFAAHRQKLALKAFRFLANIFHVLAVKSIGNITEVYYKSGLGAAGAHDKAAESGC
jgi:hypothetical protein